MVRIPKQSGFTLIETMVAMGIGLLVAMTVAQIALSNKDTYRTTMALSRLQENGRFAIGLLTHDLRMAGFQGCADPRTVTPNVIANNAPTTNLFATAVRGFETASSGWAPADLTAAPTTGFESLVVPRTDVIVAQLTEGDEGVTGDTGTAIQTAGNSSGIGVNDIVAVADCGSVDIFRVTAVAGNAFTYGASGNSGSPSKMYSTTASLMRFESNAYFIGDTGRSNASGDSVLALYRRDVDGNVLELIEGVENMQILYAERDPATGNIRYVPADDATLDMTRVIGVRIGLLITSLEAVREQDDTDTYQVAGTDIGTATTVSHPADKRLRRVFTTTIQLRNRD